MDETAVAPLLDERKRELSILQASLQNACIFMVDDDPVLVKIIAAQLRAAGHSNFAHESDPQRAFKRVLELQPDLILLDLVMPGLDGFAVLTQIRSHQDTQHLPVVMLTSSTDGATKLQALERGATDFLPKPIDSSELLLRIRNLLTVKAYQDRLAYYDPLTGLPNRLLYMDRLGWAMKHAKRNGSQVAVLDIGIDHFRKINETLGPHTGDKLLKAIAQRLLSCVRQDDVVAQLQGDELSNSISRLGGDEFSVLLTSISSADAAGYVAIRILQSMEAAFHVAEQDLFISASIGIAVYPPDGDTPDELMQHASAATEQVKKHGRSSYQFFSQEVHHRSRELLSLEMDLHQALERQQLMLLYQPQLSHVSGRVVGVEALLRWRHPERGMVAPGQFIAMAEKMGLIIPIGRWVLNEVCRCQARFARAGCTDINFSVNLSAKQFTLDSLAQTVTQALTEHQVPAPRLILELTESALMQDVEATIAILNQLRALGVKVSIDDFGTGYSSLNYLQQFPIDELKIDSSFYLAWTSIPMLRRL